MTSLASLLCAVLFCATDVAAAVEGESGDTAEATINLGAPRRGLLLHFAFDRIVEGRVTDESGHRRHGSLHGKSGYVKGVRGGALELTGGGVTGAGGGHATLPMIDFASLREFTLAVWVKERRLSYSHGEAYVVFGADRGTTEHGSICIGHFHEVVHFRVGGGYVTVPFEKADRDCWVHYAMAFRDGRVRAYKNGRLAANAPAKLSVSGKQAALGRHWWHGGALSSTRFLGALDDVRVYNRALSDRQIETLWERTGPLKQDRP